jgi:hypothetical protein
MARFVSPRTITSGLALYLDAANTKSYPVIGTTLTAYISWTIIMLLKTDFLDKNLK